jgi:hypothetical protein
MPDGLSALANQLLYLRRKPYTGCGRGAANINLKEQIKAKFT